jgi:hypothetical protein
MGTVAEGWEKVMDEVELKKEEARVGHVRVLVVALLCVALPPKPNRIREKFTRVLPARCGDAKAGGYQQSEGG